MTGPDPHPIIMWELTRACGLHCRNCPTGADDRRGANELTTFESYKAVDQIASLRPRELIITGGDPLERTDVDQIIDYARRRGLDPALVMSPTERLSSNAILRLVHHGLTRMIFSIDGSTPAVHQLGHGVVGTFADTLVALQRAESLGLAIEINTLVSRSNADDLAAIVDLIRGFRPRRWNVHFLVPVGGWAHVGLPTAEEVEKTFGALADIRDREEFELRVVEAPHFRRFLIQRGVAQRHENEQWLDFTGYESDMGELLDAAIVGARSFLHISHAGDVRASEFLPLSAGNVRYQSLGTIYRGSDLLIALRDPANLKGKCGRCEFRHLCGGSRARAWAMTGDVFAADGLCAYVPVRSA